jgi:RNase P/RNase MRP subunit POP5
VATGSTTDPVTIAATNRKAMKALVTVDSGTETHVIEALVMRDAGEASGAQVTLYGELKTNTAGIATFSADYDSGSGTIRLRAEATGVAIAPAIYPEWPGAGVTFKVVRTSLF